MASVCTGALLLAQANLLDGKRATTHWASLDLLEREYPNVNVIRNLHWVRDGNVYTSAGISAGIDLALKLVEHVLGQAVARQTAKYMEYTFPESNERRVQF